MAIIGFIVLVLMGLYFVALAGVLWFGAAWGGSSGIEALIPLVVAIALFWAARHWAPFTISFVGG